MIMFVIKNHDKYQTSVAIHSKEMRQKINLLTIKIQCDSFSTRPKKM